MEYPYMDDGEWGNRVEWAAQQDRADAAEARVIELEADAKEAEAAYSAQRARDHVAVREARRNNEEAESALVKATRVWHEGHGDEHGHPSGFPALITHFEKRLTEREEVITTLADRIAVLELEAKTLRRALHDSSVALYQANRQNHGGSC